MAYTKRFVHNENNNAICYYRYSSSAQRDCSIEQQQKAAHQYCKDKGYRIIGEYEDRAVTGTRKDRQGFQRMLNEVEKLRPGYLILWKTDRFSRDRYDAVLGKYTMRECGVKIEYVAESLPEDEAERVLIEGIEESIAAHYVLQHRKNVIRGLMYNAENCLYNGHKLLGYSGKPNEKYLVDEKTANIVRKIFADYTSGKKMREIADELNQMGFKTTRNKEFTEKALWHILQNRSYIGEYQYGDIVVPGGMPAIITDEQFEQAQSMLKTSKHGNRGRKIKTKEDVDFWLTGKLKCGMCGEPFSGTGGTSHTGAVHYYYNCTRHKKSAKECSKKNVKKELLEETVVYALGSVIINPTNRLLIAYRVYKKYLKDYVPDDSRERAIKTEIKEIDIKLDNIMTAIEAGIYNEMTQSRMLELSNNKKMLMDQLAEEVARRENALRFKDVYKYFEDYAGMLSDRDGRNKLLYGLVDTILVYDDSIELIMYYSLDHRHQSFETIQNIKNRSYELRKVTDNSSEEDELWDNTDFATMFKTLQEGFVDRVNSIETEFGEKDTIDAFELMYKELDRVHETSSQQEWAKYVGEHFF